MVFVVLHGDRQAVLLGDRDRSLQRLAATTFEVTELLQGIEVLITSAGNDGRPGRLRAGADGGLHVLIEPSNVGPIARQTNDRLDEHPPLSDLAAERFGLLG